MSTPKSPKKPRARKLERDRAANKETTGKAGSPRHAAAKDAAAKKRAKPKGKGVVKTKVRARDEAAPKSRASRTVSSEDAPVSKKRAEAPRAATRGTDVWNPSGKPQRKGGEKPSGTRGSRDRYEEDRPVRAPRARREDFDSRPPSRRRDDAPVSRARRDDAPVSRARRDDAPASRPTRDRYSDDRPVRARRDDAPVSRARRDDSPVSRARRDDAPVSRAPRARREEEAPTRAPRTKREEVYAPKSRLPREKVSTERVSSKHAMSEDTAEVELDSNSSTWAELGVHEGLLSTLKRQGIETPFPIQAKTLPDAISGRDVLGRGQTGSGKTLAFGLAMITRLAYRKATAKHPLGIVLVPTRELAMQVTDALMPYAQSVDLDIRLIAGGMPYAKQIDALKRGVPIVVATPGRLNDLVEQGHINLSKIEITILDEADQMCDMGFMPQIVEVLDMTKPGSQRLLFSATLDADVDKIVKKYLKNPIEHATNSGKASVTTMTHYLFITYSEDKPSILAEIGSREGKTMFFARTQAGVDRIANDLAKQGVPAGALHGGKTQAVRTRTLAAFKEGLTNVLVATDVAARGIHVDGVSLVVHIDPPNDHKDYLHRAGRTARAGETGKVVTMVGPRQQRTVTAMTNRAGVEPEVVKVKPMSKELIAVTGARKPSGIAWKPPAEPAKRGGGRPGGGRSGGGSRSGGPRSGGGARSGTGSRSGAGSRGGSSRSSRG
ncbi:MAG: DEAD/DEAH box helicase [Actinomycetes bacterium]